MDGTDLARIEPNGELSRTAQELRAADADRVALYALPALSANTARAYESHLRGLAAWCADREICDLPLTEDQVIAYITWCVTRPEKPMRPNSLRPILAAIKAAHENAGFVSPTGGARVRHARRNLDREYQGGRVRKARPAVAADVRAMAQHAAEPQLADLRDAAVVLVGYGTAERRSELGALNVDDVERLSRGRVRIRIGSSKTDQTGRGEYIYLPAEAARALDAWLEAAGITQGPIFRPVTRHGAVVPRPLSGQAINLIVQRRAAGADLGEGWSAHSLRRGAATEAAGNGATVWQLKALGRWKTMDMPGEYAEVTWAEDPDALLGLETGAED